ncbi:cingulin isoform X2 [Numida meleagris]|uniref:cingulin isoform X2 n=1 Tax=Numida meleagris TaxID=8996 RepID=UPI000B3D8262|nr:cingulin isoform X2 [Numida meleagris]
MGSELRGAGGAAWGWRSAGAFCEYFAVGSIRGRGSVCAVTTAGSGAVLCVGAEPPGPQPYGVSSLPWVCICPVGPCPPYGTMSVVWCVSTSWGHVCPMSQHPLFGAMSSQWVSIPLWGHACPSEAAFPLWDHICPMGTCQPYRAASRQRWGAQTMGPTVTLPSPQNGSTAPGMERAGEKQSPVDYGVQIRFINDLQEPKKAPKARAKPGSYGVAVRVQGIAGQPFVVLNSGDKGGDSFGVQIKGDSSYPAGTPSTRHPELPHEPDLPENPYVHPQPSYSMSDEEHGAAPVPTRHKPRSKMGSELRRTRSHGNLLAATDAPMAPGSRSSSTLSIAHATHREGSGFGVTPSDSESPGSQHAGGDIDTEPLSSVNSLISKFDGKVQQRGRAARRSRVAPEERKRSQSLDARSTVPDGRTVSAPSPLPTGAGRSTAVNRGTEERPQSKAQTELQLKSTPDLLRDQQEVAQPGSSEDPKELIYGILKEGSRDSGAMLKRKAALVLEKLQEAPTKGTACSQPQHHALAQKVEELQKRLDEESKLRQKLELTKDHGTTRALEEAQEESGRLRAALERRIQELQRSTKELGEAKAAQARAEEQLKAARAEMRTAPDTDTLYKELEEAREELEEALSSRQRLEEHLRLRERELTALKGALKEEVANHDRELERVRLQCHSDMEQLRRSVEDISQNRADLESEKQKIGAVVRNLQRELEESAEETGHWREMFQRNKDELRAAKQELLQVKMEREEFEEELRELRERFTAAREEVERARSSAADPGEMEALRTELRRAREAQWELAQEKEQQEEVVRQREEELQALRSTVRDEAQSHSGAIEQCHRDMERLREERDEAVRAKVSLESEREAAEAALRELQEQHEELRRKVQGLETQLKDYERMGENWEGSQARLREKVTKLEAERRRAEESLGEATDREQELLRMQRTLETRLDEAQRGMARLTQEQRELSASLQDEQRQKEQLKRAKNELEEQKRLLDRSTEKLNRELEQMTEESNRSLAALKAQLEECKEKSRKEITDSQKQAKDRSAEVEKMQFSVGRLQDEVARLKQALQDSQAERDGALLERDVMLQRLRGLEEEADAKRRSQDDRSRQLKALEEKSKRLEEELEEERSTAELLTERVNRSRDQIDQLRAELLQERSSRQDLECDKVSLERQNKELKSRLASSEGMQKAGGSVSQLEARLEELQDRLQAEEREKSVLQSSNRKLERKVKELTIQIDDERQHVNDQKDQLSLRVKALKRQVDEAEEEIERLEAARKKAQRELEEQHELNEQLQGRVKALEKDAWRRAARAAADSSLQDDALSSDEDLDSAYGPSSITSLLNEANLQTSSC